MESNILNGKFSAILNLALTARIALHVPKIGRLAELPVPDSHRHFIQFAFYISYTPNFVAGNMPLLSPRKYSFSCPLPLSYC